ncbi:glycosyltransferase family 4 protein [bacterium]|nr:glycosyltransferase family 4 protein [bacterium]
MRSSKKHILFITQYFPPEMGACAGRIYKFAVGLRKRGYRVTVFTEIPNYPSGKIHKDYKGRLFKRENIESVDVWRLPVFPNSRITIVGRIGYYLSFMISAIFFSIFRSKVDVVFATSPPSTVALAGVFIKFFKGCKAIVDIRDLWAGSIISMGYARWSLAGFLIFIEHFVYKNASIITTISKEVKKIVALEAGFESDNAKIVCLENAVNPEVYSSVGKIDKWKGKFVVMYSGSLGIAQGLMTVIDVAILLKEYPDIHFVFIGDGVERDKLESVSKGLNNVEFLGEKPRSMIPEYLKRADTALVPLKDVEQFKAVYPIKLIEYLAAGVPVICSLKGESARVVEEFNVGIVVPPEDPPKLAEAIINLYHDKNKRDQFASNTHRIIKKNFYLPQKLEALERIINSQVIF